MTSARAANPATHCPLCGQANQCAMEVERATGQPQEACWCMQASFPPALLDQVPAESRGTACICLACSENAASLA
ncbi:cysteine-rich CWC family protein [Ottowia thiooxydans]|uniref:cysteine-rich CWC family protein n=1 Tax=Ottowia thiooxydans TaxID=219182 RepID=UPI0009FF7724|nr:cysteine-rich CWC family protein [Ottowia thiooxydans]